MATEVGGGIIVVSMPSLFSYWQRAWIGISHQLMEQLRDGILDELAHMDKLW